MADEEKPIEIVDIEIVGDLPHDVRRELELALPRAAKMAQEMLRNVELAARQAWELARDPRIVSVQIVVKPGDDVEPMKLETDGRGQVLWVKERRFRPREERIIVRADGTSGLIPEDEPEP